MKCYICNEEASAKIGSSKGNIFSALFGKKCWSKQEIYVCKDHYDKYTRGKSFLKRDAKEETKVETRLIKIPKNYKFLLLEVGDESHEPTEETLKRSVSKLKEAIDKKNDVIAIPYWVKLKVLK